MKKITITVLLLLTVTMLNAQSNYRPGYIITNNNDTVNGFIDFRTDKANARVCKFKPSETGGERLYNPGEIAGFRYIEDGKYYVSRDFLIKGKQEKAFWEYLVQGVLSLYFLPDEEADYYLFEDEAGEVTLVPKVASRVPPSSLNFQPDLKFEGNKMYEKPDNRYVGIVRYRFRDVESVAKEVNNVQFNHPSMIKLTKKYHDAVCTTGEECIVFETKLEDKSSVKTQISVYGGLQTVSYHLPRLDFGVIFHCLSPVIGVQFNLSNLRWQKSFSLQADISFSQLRGNAHLSKIDVGGYPRIDRYLKYHTMIADGKMGVKYTYPKGKVRPLAEAGVLVSYLFASSGTNHSFGQNIEGGQINESIKDLLFPTLMYGYYMGVGVDYSLKNDHFLLFRAGFDYEIGSNNIMVKYTDKIKIWQFKIGYTF